MKRQTNQVVLALCAGMLFGGMMRAQEPFNVLDGFTPPSIAPGSPAGSFPLSGFETVSPYSGKLNFALPLLQIGGRGEAGYTMMLTINQTWFVDIVEYTCPQGPPVCYSEVPRHNWWTTRKPGYSPGVVHSRTGAYNLECGDGFSTSSTRSTLTRLTFTGPDGTEIELRDEATNGQPQIATRMQPCHESFTAPFSRGQIFKSADGSAVTFHSDTAITDSFVPLSDNLGYPTGHLHFPDGITYRVESGLVKSIRDRNGNLVKMTYDGATNRVTSIVDPLGRIVQITYDVQAGGELYDQIQYTGHNSSTRTIRVKTKGLASVFASPSYTTKVIGCDPAPCDALFPEAQIFSAFITTFAASVVSAVELPNSRTYSFFYNPYAELERVILPTGGKIEYTWGSVSPTGGSGYYVDLNRMIFRGVTERRVYRDASNLESKTLYTRTYPVVTGLGTTAAEVRHVDTSQQLLAKEIHRHYGRLTNAASGLTSVDHSSWKEGLEFRTERFDTNGSSILRATDQTWNQRPGVGAEPIWWGTLEGDFAPPSDPRLSQSVETFNDASLVRKQSFVYDRYNNRASVKEYAFGSGAAGSLVRELATTYVTTNQGTDYSTNLDVHLRRLPKVRETKNASSQTIARTEYFYDEADPLARTGITSHCSTEPAPGGGNPDFRCKNNAGAFATFGSTFRHRGNVTRAVRLHTQGTDVQTSQTLDIAGNPTTVTDGRQNPWTLTYQSPTFAFITSVTDPAPPAFIRSAGYDAGLGRMTLFTDRANVNATFAYSDSLDRLSEVVEASNQSSVSRKTIFQYDDATPKVTVLADQATFGAGERKTETVFDGLGREIESRLYEPSSTFSKTLTEYDNMGRVRRASNPFRTGSPDWTTNTYDALSRVTLVAHPDGSQTATFYNGSKAVVRDPAGKRLLSESDALGRLISVREDPPCQTWESNCPAGSHLDYTTTYVYDILDNLTQVTQGAQTRTFAYDSLSRLICASNPETRVGSASCAGTPATSGLDRFTYDANGNLLTKLDSRGVTAAFAYDKLNRVTSKTFSGTPTAPNVTFTYDNTSVNFSKGRLTSVSSSASITNVAHYDARGRVVQGNQQTEGQTYPFSYTYLRDDSLASMTYPSLRVVTYTYDNAGRPLSLSGAAAGQTATSYASSMTYAAHGAMGQLKLGNNVWETSAYNSRLQPSSMVTGTTQGGSNLLNLAFGYGTSNNNGNVLSQTIVMPKQSSGTLTLTQAYGYDGVNRLASVGETVTAGGSGGGAWSFTHGYDPFGNMWVTPTGGLTAHVTTPTQQSQINASTNRLTGTGVTYDAAGNLTAYPFLGGMQYDAENHQKQFTSGSTTVTYHYDGDGRRVKQVKGSETTVFVYDAFGNLAADYSTATPTGTAGRRYRTTDHLGSARLVTDSAGAVVSRHDYLPFGEELPASSSAGNRNLVFGFGVSPSERHKFTGKERDVESNLDYFIARYYSSPMGRFTSVDEGPLRASDPQSVNRYAYVRNNPVRLVDDHGKYWVEAVRGRGGRLQQFVVKRHETSVANAPQIDPVTPVIDMIARQRTGDTNDQIPIPLPGLLGKIGSVLGVDSKSALGEKAFTNSFQYSFKEGLELDEKAFGVASDLLGVTPDRKLTGGVVSIGLNREQLNAFRRIHRGVRIGQEIGELEAQVARETDVRKAAALDRDIRERRADDDYRYLQELLEDREK